MHVLVSILGCPFIPFLVLSPVKHLVCSAFFLPKSFVSNLIFLPVSLFFPVSFLAGRAPIELRHARVHSCKQPEQSHL